MEQRLSTIHHHHRSSIMPINLFDSPHSPKGTGSSAPSDWFDVASPQLRKTSVLRKTIILPNGMTLDEQLNLILAKPERTLAEAKILYEAIKDFPIIKMIFPQPGDKTFDMESILYLVRRMKLMKMNAGDIVYTQDDASNGQMYVVYSGEISLCIKDPDHITTQNYERFENEQKKRTMGKIGSSRKLNVNLKKIQSNQLAQNSSRSKRSPRPGETPEPEQENSTDFKEKEETDDHVFKLLKSYMTENLMPQQTAVMPEKLGTAVENDATTISGITKAFVKFKKFLKNRSTMLNAAKNYGVIRDKLSIGAFFGTTIDLGLRKREETAFALRDTELLAIDYKDLNHVKAGFTKKRIALKNFMFDNFPKLDLYQSEKIVSGLLGTLEEKNFEGGSYIINEGQPGEHFYIIQSGTCEISKEIIIDESSALGDKLSQNRALLRVHPSVKKKVALTSLSQGIFFGDELVFQAQKYFFTVKVTSSKATLIAINIKTFAARFPRVVFDSIKGLYLSKTQHYLEILRTQLMSAQYENYDISSELSTLSMGDKKAVLDHMNIKDLWSPIRLKPKKKLASAIGSPVATPRLSPMHKATSGFSSPSNFEAKSSMMMKDFSLGFGGFGSGSNSPVKESTSGVMESREKLKNLIGPTSPLNPVIGGGKQKNWSALNLPTSQKEMLVKVTVLNNNNSMNPQTEGDSKNDEEMDRIRKSYKTRTAVMPDSPLLKHINIQGKDGISYLNSHKAPIKGQLDFKDIEEIDPKMQQKITPDMSLEALKLGIRLSDPKKQSSLSGRKKESKFKGGETSKNKEEPEETIGSSQREHLPVLLSNTSPKRTRAISNAPPEDDGFRTSPIQLTPIRENSAAQNNQSEIPVIHSGLGRNRSMPDTTRFVREVNILDVPLPKDTAEYIAKKKHLKIKERMMVGEGQEDILERVSNKNSPAFFNKNEMAVKTATVSGNYKDVLDLMIKGGTPKEKTVLPNLKVVHKYDSLIESYGNKSKDEAKKCGSIQWPDSQSILLKEKGKVHQQLRRKPLAKSFFQIQPFGGGDLELKGSVKQNFK